ncbi:MAG: hypothetical protein GY822_25780, partial [Deltaproteobacteria bacterium]|nr:hypothetical protein [Deltaproteobacteria bacterium]
GTIAFAGRHRTQAVALLGDLRIGDSLDVRVLRAGKRIDLELKLKPYQTLVRRKQYDVQPRFLLWGGLVLQPLSEDFLDTWNEWRRRAPTILVHAFKSGMRSEKQHEMVVLARVLADESTAGYDDREFEIVEEIDGDLVKNLQHAAELFKKAQGLITLKTHRGLIVLDVEKALERNDAIKLRYQIPSSSRLG